jgi:hypothetical protein
MKIDPWLSLRHGDGSPFSPEERAAIEAGWAEYRAARIKVRITGNYVPQDVEDTNGAKNLCEWGARHDAYKEACRTRNFAKFCMRWGHTYQRKPAAT